MRPSAWARLAPRDPAPQPGDWLAAVLERNAGCEYLRRHASPRTAQAFRCDVPMVTYEQLRPWMTKVERGEADVLFAGRPVAFERTGGSSGGAKLIPYSADGLADFRRAIVPWLRDVVRRFDIAGSAYFSISPATRAAESIAAIPVGLPDGAYLGDEAAAMLAEVTAVPLEVGAIADVEQWRTQTLRHLAAARDLELISVWSPTFLLRLLDDLPDPGMMWPRLKLVSCWASGASAPFAAELATRLPHARLQPKGLLSTEAVLTVPDDQDRPVLARAGYFEFLRGARLHLADELSLGETYEVVATTASGLYRYRTGDLVRCDGSSADGRPILEFVGRGDLVCDLVGEKLSEPFVERCLAGVGGFRLLVPDAGGDGYVLAVESGRSVDVAQVDRQLCQNPQYAYARRIGQLGPLRLCHVERLFDRYSSLQVDRSVRVGDVKPVALRKERSWTTSLGLSA
jgi:hypothetical protein